MTDSVFDASRPPLERALVLIQQARRDLWWFIETFTDDDEDVVARAMSIQDDLLYPAIEAICAEAQMLSAVHTDVERTFRDVMSGEYDRRRRGDA